MEQDSKFQANCSLENNSQGKVPFISKLAYGMGDVGCNFSWMFVGNFLMIFYTDVFGISMSAVATLMLVSRFWDAINDPIIGTLTDKTHTRWGRFRPWLLFGQLQKLPYASAAVLHVVEYLPPAVHDFHRFQLPLRQRARLIGKQDVHASRRFDPDGFSHHYFIFQHSQHIRGQHHRDHHRQSLGHRHDDDGDG